MASIAHIGKPLDSSTPKISAIALAKIEIYDILLDYHKYMPDREIKSAVDRLVDLFIKE